MIWKLDSNSSLKAVRGEMGSKRERKQVRATIYRK